MSSLVPDCLGLGDRCSSRELYARRKALDPRLGDLCSVEVQRCEGAGQIFDSRVGESMVAYEVKRCEGAGQIKDPRVGNLCIGEA